MMVRASNTLNKFSGKYKYILNNLKNAKKKEKNSLQKVTHK